MSGANRACDAHSCRASCAALLAVSSTSLTTVINDSDFNNTTPLLLCVSLLEMASTTGLGARGIAVMSLDPVAKMLTRLVLLV